MKIERRGRSAAARQAGGVDAIGATFGFADEGGGGWHFERAVESRSERAAFKALCDRLRMRNNLRAWRHRNPEKNRAAVLRAMAKRRTGPRTETCRVCGREYQTTKFSVQCSTKCRNRWHGKARTAKRNRGIRNRGLTDAIATVLAASPWIALGEIVERVAALDRKVKSRKGSVASTLTLGLTAGRFIHDGAKIRRRYALAGAAAIGGGGT